MRDFKQTNPQEPSTCHEIRVFQRFESRKRLPDAKDAEKLRQIGTIESPKRAEQFAAYLTTLGTTSSLDVGSTGTVVWIHEEDRVAAAKEELQKFLQEPEHERYRNATQQAAEVSRQRQAKTDSTRRQIIDVRDRWTQPTIEQGPLTFALLVTMMIVGFLTGFEPEKRPEFAVKMAYLWPQIQSGEFWRLVTPIFVHYGILHVLFNFLWLREFGLNVEYRIGTPRYLILVLAVALISNSVQYFMSGPFFGGMSGVNYGLFGYIWVRMKLEPESGFWVSRYNTIFLFGWFVLCVLIPSVHAANWAHGGGLVVGVVAGASRTAWRSFTGQR